MKDRPYSSSSIEAGSTASMVSMIHQLVNTVNCLVNEVHDIKSILHETRRDQLTCQTPSSHESDFSLAKAFKTPEESKYRGEVDPRIDDVLYFQELCLRECAFLMDLRYDVNK